MSDTPDWAKALGCVPSGLFIVTAGTGDDATGLLASWVQQVGFEPPTVSIAVKQDRHAAQLIRREEAFCVSILDERSKGLLGHFARGFAAGDPAFVDLETGVGESGVPFLPDALAWLECRLVGEAAWSDHVLFGGCVIAGGTRGDGDAPMVHLRKTGLSY